jgi:hypothetical protein
MFGLALNPQGWVSGETEPIHKLLADGTWQSAPSDKLKGATVWTRQVTATGNVTGENTVTTDASGFIVEWSNVTRSPGGETISYRTELSGHQVIGGFQVPMKAVTYGFHNGEQTFFQELYVHDIAVGAASPDTMPVFTDDLELPSVFDWFAARPGEEPVILERDGSTGEVPTPRELWTAEDYRVAK